MALMNIYTVGFEVNSFLRTGIREQGTGISLSPAWPLRWKPFSNPEAAARFESVASWRIRQVNLLLGNVCLIFTAEMCNANLSFRKGN
jgi:hypothetical protein